jgi:hypothetical protein
MHVKGKGEGHMADLSEIAIGLVCARDLLHGGARRLRGHSGGWILRKRVLERNQAGRRCFVDGGGMRTLKRVTQVIGHRRSCVSTRGRYQFGDRVLLGSSHRALLGYEPRGLHTYIGALRARTSLAFRRPGLCCKYFLLCPFRQPSTGPGNCSLPLRHREGRAFTVGGGRDNVWRSATCFASIELRHGD